MQFSGNCWILYLFLKIKHYSRAAYFRTLENVSKLCVYVDERVGDEKAYQKQAIVQRRRVSSISGAA